MGIRRPPIARMKQGECGRDRSRHGELSSSSAGPLVGRRERRAPRAARGFE
jgi:hypothetical protein